MNSDQNDGSHANANLNAISALCGPPPSEEPRFCGDESHPRATNGTPGEGCEALEPVNWSVTYKWSAVVLISLMTTIVNFAIFICAPATPQILSDFRSDDEFYSVLIVSVWELGETAGPLFIGPLSEILGRRPVYHTANICFVLLSMINGFSINISMVIAFRFLTGLSVASLSLNAPIIGDMFIREQRGRAMAIMGVAPLFGTAIGPIIGGYLSASLSWRWNFWLVAILTAATEVILLVILRESHKPILLERQTRHLRHEQYGSRHDAQYALAGTDTLSKALLRPATLFLRSPVLILMTLYVSYVYGVTYLIFTTLAEVFQYYYDFSQGTIGLVYLGIALGMAVGTLISGLTLDRYLKYKAASSPAEPENRLLPAACGAALVPVGLLIYGWTVSMGCHWIWPIIGTAILSCGLVVGQIASSSYLVDVFGKYSASAIAASLVVRYLTSTLLPLAGPPSIRSIGVGWTGTILSCIALIFMSIPLILIKYGKGLRSRYDIKV